MIKVGQAETEDQPAEGLLYHEQGHSWVGKGGTTADTGGGGVGVRSQKRNTSSPHPEESPRLS